MFKGCIGYRHADGGVRGYVGFSFGADAAIKDAEFKAHMECRARGEVYDTSRRILCVADCYGGEHKALKKQWKAIAMAHKLKGASIY